MRGNTRYTLWIAALLTTALSGSNVKLAWQASPSQGVVGYNIYRSANSTGSLSRINQSLVFGLEFTDESVQPGFNYFYAVTALGSNGLESGFSNSVKAEVFGAAELHLSVQRRGDFIAGAPSGYRVLVDNAGEGPTRSNLLATFQLPQDFRFETGGSKDWGCSAVARTVLCRFEGELGSQQSSSFDVSFWIGTSESNSGELRIEVVGEKDSSLRDEIVLDEQIRHGLFFPYYRTAPGSFSSLVLSNSSDQDAAVDLIAFGADGNPLKLERNPVSLSLARGTQMAVFGFDYFGAGKLEEEVGWIQVISDQPRVHGFFQFGDLSLTRLDGATALQELSRNLLFTRILQGAAAFRGHRVESTIDLVNPTADIVRLSLRLRDSNGSVRSQVERFLAPRSILSETPSGLFGALPGVAAYAEVEVLEGDGVVGFERMQLGGVDTVVGLNPAQDRSNELYSPQIATGLGLFTSLQLVNSSTFPRDISLRAISEDGSDLVPAASLSLEPGEAMQADLQQLFGLPSGRISAASLVVESDGPGVSGDVIIGEAQSMSFAAAMPLQGRKFLEASFDHVANTDSFFTGLALFNPGDHPAQVTLEVHRQDGGIAGVARFVLVPGGRLSQTVAQLVPASEGQMGGFVKVHSSAPLVAQQLFGDTSANTLSSVPAAILVNGG